jgi:diguanylate cyclase (GGDEF)-like protein
LGGTVSAERRWSLAAGALLPVVALVGAGFAVRPLAALPPAALGVAALLPTLFGLGGIALAARFDRGRSLHCLALLLVAFWTLRLLDGASDGLAPRLTWAMLCTALPLALAALAVLPDHGAIAPWRDPRSLLLATPLAVGLAAALAGRDGLVALLGAPLGRLGAWSPVPPVAQVIALLAAGLLYGRYYARPSIQRGALLGALATAALALHRVHEPAAVIAFLGAGLLLLTAAVLQESWSVAYVDPLTELPGRRALEERLRSLGPRYAIAMLDVDHFKGFNDIHGHHVGDEVLRLVAAHLREVGGGGSAYRYGGEEFTVVFPGSDAAGALPALEALREEIAASRFAKRRRDRRRDEPPEAGGAIPDEISLTVSIGVADAGDAATPHGVIEAADQALYRAKGGGRNRTETARDRTV